MDKIKGQDNFNKNLSQADVNSIKSKDEFNWIKIEDDFKIDERVVIRMNEIKRILSNSVE